MLYSICLFAWALLYYGGQTQGCNHCPTGFLHLQKEEKCYKAIPVPVTWDEAFNICSKLGAHLPVVHNVETNVALRSVFTPVKGLCPDSHFKAFSFWTAGRFPCEKSPPFKWVTGNGNQWKMGYTNWLKGEPNNDRNNISEDCINIVDDGTDLYGWNDANCRNKYCVICEIDI